MGTLRRRASTETIKELEVTVAAAKREVKAYGGGANLPIQPP